MRPVRVSAPVAFGLFTTTPFYVILKKTSGCDILKGGCGMPRILLVEDDAGIVSGLTDFLRSEGFEVESAPGQR